VKKLMRNFLKLIVIIQLLFATNLFAQIENVIVETYYITDANDISDTVGGVLEFGTTTYRIYIDLKEGSVLKKVYGNEFHPLIFKTTTNFFNHKTEGKSFAKDFNKNRFKESTVALDSWLTIGQISNSASPLHGVLKSKDTNGSFVGGINHDNGLLANTSNNLGIALQVSDGIINFNYPLTNWGSSGIVNPATSLDSTIFGSLVTGSEFVSYNAGIQNSGTVGINLDENIVLIAQLTTKGLLSFELNLEVEIPNPDGGTFTVNYVANKDTLFNDEQLSPYLTYPFLCGCANANYLEYSDIYACNVLDSCKTPIVLGCMDTAACNYDPKANYNVSSLCCFPGYCNDRELAIVCPDIAPDFIKFFIFPNPCSAVLTLNIWLKKPAEVFYSIESILGTNIRPKATLGEIQGNTNKQIEVADLENGIYYFELKIGDIFQRKVFIKN